MPLSNEDYWKMGENTEDLRRRIEAMQEKAANYDRLQAERDELKRKLQQLEGINEQLRIKLQQIRNIVNA